MLLLNAEPVIPNANAAAVKLPDCATVTKCLTLRKGSCVAIDSVLRGNRDCNNSYLINFKESITLFTGSFNATFAPWLNGL
ncbi:hypothetical protein D3C78_1486080 [compost metagenome]